MWTMYLWARLLNRSFHFEIFFRKYEFYRGGYKWGNNSSDICISHPEWTNESLFEWYPAEQEFAFVPYFLGGSVSGEHVGPPPRPIPITMYGLGLREQIFLDHSRARICSYIHYNVWDEITHPFPKFNGTTVKVWEWMSNFIPCFIVHVITHPYWD